MPSRGQDVNAVAAPTLSEAVARLEQVFGKTRAAALASAALAAEGVDADLGGSSPDGPSDVGLLLRVADWLERASEPASVVAHALRIRCETYLAAVAGGEARAEREIDVGVASKAAAEVVRQLFERASSRLEVPVSLLGVGLDEAHPLRGAPQRGARADRFVVVPLERERARALGVDCALVSVARPLAELELRELSGLASEALEALRALQSPDDVVDAGATC